MINYAEILLIIRTLYKINQTAKNYAKLELSLYTDDAYLSYWTKHNSHCRELMDRYFPEMPSLEGGLKNHEN